MVLVCLIELSSMCTWCTLIFLGLYGSNYFYSYTSRIAGTRVVGRYQLSTMLLSFLAKENYNLRLFFTYREEYTISKTAVNLLNLPDDPCDESDVQMNIQECIKDGMEKKLNCTIPDFNSGEAMAPVGKLNSRLCSTRADYLNYKRLYDESLPVSYPTEAAISNEFGCIASCQDSNKVNEHFSIIGFSKTGQIWTINLRNHYRD